MTSRREFLVAASTVAGASLAGCSLTASESASATAPGRWLTEEVGTIRSDRAASDEEPEIDWLGVYDPDQANSTDAIPQSVVDLHPAFSGQAGEVSFDPAALDVVVVAQYPRVAVAIGDFDAEDARSQFPEGVSESGSYGDTTLFVGEQPRDPFEPAGYAVGDGTYGVVYTASSEEHAVESLEALLDTAEGSGAPLGDEEPASQFADFLEDGVYQQYSDVGTDDTPWAMSLALDGDVASRRTVVVFDDESEAAEFSLLDDEVLADAREESEGGRRRPQLAFGPYTELSVTRDGRAVRIDGTLPTDEIGLPEFQYP